MIDEPKWYINLRKWRERNECTTEAWKAYVEARNIQEVILILALVCTAYTLVAAVERMLG